MDHTVYVMIQMYIYSLQSSQKLPFK